jgi:hypothetical protein
MFSQYDVYDAEAVHESFDCSVQEESLEVFEYDLCLVEDVVYLGEGLFDLVHGVLFLYVVKGALDVHYLELNHVDYLF